MKVNFINLPILIKSNKIGENRRKSIPNHFIDYNNVYVNSQIEFLSDKGKIELIKSKNNKIKNLFITLNGSLDDENYFYNSDSDIFEMSKYEKIIFDENNNIKSIEDHKLNDDINENEDKRYYSISIINYIFLKILNLMNINNVEVVHYYSEFDYIPFILKVFFHIPLILTTLIILIVIFSFNPELSKDFIREEIKKLDERLYDTDIEIQECTVCLEKFEIKESIRILPCKHCFHKECIDNWLLNSLYCPICREPVSKITETLSYEIYRNMNYI